MLDFLREWIKEIVILLVLATFIDLALPSSSLKKYVDYTVGLILLLLLLSPVLKLIDSELDVSTMLASAEQYSGRAMVTVEPLSDKSAWLAYQLVLEARVVQLATEFAAVQSATASVTVDQNSSSPSYGNPLAMEVSVVLHQPLIASEDGDLLRQQIEDKLRTTYGLETAQVGIYIRR